MLVTVNDDVARVEKHVLEFCALELIEPMQGMMHHQNAKIDCAKLVDGVLQLRFGNAQQPIIPQPRLGARGGINVLKTKAGRVPGSVDTN